MSPAAKTFGMLVSSQYGRTFERPATGVGFNEVAAGENESAVVEGNCADEPVAVRSGTDEDEQRICAHCARRTIGTIAQDEMIELSPGSAIDDLSSDTNSHVR